MYRILIIAALFFVISTNQQSHAQNKETVASMISCLHEAPLPTENADGDEFLQCITTVLEECSDFDPLGGFGEGELTAENCYLTVAEEIKSKMNSHLENGWPDKSSTAYQLRKLAIEYNIKQSELKCEFEGAVLNVGNEPWLGEVDQSRLYFNNRHIARCYFGYFAGNYLTVIVHEQMR